LELNKTLSIGGRLCTFIGTNVLEIPISDLKLARNGRSSKMFEASLHEGA